MAPHLPGFYFDSVKNRYFKIIPNHLASEESKYSVDAINRQAKHHLQEAKGVHKSSITIANHAPLPIRRLGDRVKLLRESGLSKTPATGNIVDCWASGLERQTLFFDDRCPRCPDITHFVKDDLTNCFLYTQATLENHWQDIFGARPLLLQAKESKGGIRRFNQIVYCYKRFLGRAPVSSMSLSRSRVLLATVMTHVGVNIRCMSLEDPRDHFDLDEDWFTHRSRENIAAFPYLFTRHCGSSKLPISPAWSSAANPFSTSPRFAVGLSGKVSDISENEGAYGSTTVQRPNDTIYSVDWLDHNTIISGGRRGEIVLWDTRSGGENMRFQYPALINHIRKLEGTRIAIAGADESIHIQDLRILPKPGVKKAQEPYMTFLTSGGPVASHLQAGFDVHADLIAAATADRRVQLFNVRTGKEVIMTQIEKQGPLKGQARCVKFAENEGEAMKLYVASGSVVQEWSWVLGIGHK